MRPTRIRDKQMGRMEKFYQSENPIDTRNFTFKEAVEGSCGAALQIQKLDEKFEIISDEMKERGKSNGVFNFIFKRRDYKENKNYPDNENDRKVRKQFRRNAIMPLFAIPIMFIGPLYGVAFALGVSVSSIYLICLFIFLFSTTLPSRIRKERKKYPWRFNTQPLGSTMYLLQQDALDILEKTHRLYYDIYLPCKSKADTLISSSENRGGEYYDAYKDVSRYGTYLYKCTPKQRIKDFQKKYLLKNVKFAASVATIATVAFTGAAFAAFNKAGKDIGNYPKSKDRY